MASYSFSGVSYFERLIKYPALWLVIVGHLVVNLALIGYTWLPTPLATGNPFKSFFIKISDDKDVWQNSN